MKGVPTVAAGVSAALAAHTRRRVRAGELPADFPPDWRARRDTAARYRVRRWRSLAALRPDLAGELHPTRNGPRPLCGGAVVGAARLVALRQVRPRLGGKPEEPDGVSMVRRPPGTQRAVARRPMPRSRRRAAFEPQRRPGIRRRSAHPHRRSCGGAVETTAASGRCPWWRARREAAAAEAAYAAEFPGNGPWPPYGPSSPPSCTPTATATSTPTQWPFTRGASSGGAAPAVAGSGERYKAAPAGRAAGPDAAGQQRRRTRASE
jgi:hypothetical protein